MISIREVRKVDLTKLASIYVRAYNSLNIGEKWEESRALKLMNWFYKKQSDLFFVVENNNKIIGAIVAILKPWWDGNRLTDGEIFIDPSWQGKGIGTLLIKKLFQEAKRKYQVISWDTFTHIVYEHPLRWYKKIGFEEIKNWKIISGNIDQVLTMISKDKKF